jgi:hypothetical protein
MDACLDWSLRSSDPLKVSRRRDRRRFSILSRPSPQFKSSKRMTMYCPPPMAPGFAAVCQNPTLND